MVTGTSQILIRAADYSADYALLRQIRFAVFVDEQQVPPELEMDERDHVCHHVLAFVDGRAVGTGRIDVARDGKLGRMAVLDGYRGLGVGMALLEALHDIARAQGCTVAWCHAQVRAAGFYANAGYVAEGDVFDEADIPHVLMRASLR